MLCVAGENRGTVVSRRPLRVRPRWTTCARDGLKPADTDRLESRPFEKSMRVSVSRRKRVISDAALLASHHRGASTSEPRRPTIPRHPSLVSARRRGCRPHARLPLPVSCGRASRRPRQRTIGYADEGQRAGRLLEPTPLGALCVRASLSSVCLRVCADIGLQSHISGVFSGARRSPAAARSVRQTTPTRGRAAGRRRHDASASGRHARSRIRGAATFSAPSTAPTNVPTADTLG